LGRPSKPLISREGAARAALQVIDGHGLDALSVDLVAQRMGIKAPSLYYHFKHKSELLSEVARLILTDVEVPARGEGDWKQSMLRLSVATRRSVLRHPNAAPLLLQFFPRYVLLAAYDHWIAPCPLPVERHMVLIEGLEKLTFGSALFEASCRTRGIEPMPEFDRERLPHLAAAVKAGVAGDETIFTACVLAFLEGVSRVEPAAAGVTPRRPAVKKAVKRR